MLRMLSLFCIPIMLKFFKQTVKSNHFFSFYINEFVAFSKYIRIFSEFFINFEILVFAVFQGYNYITLRSITRKFLEGNLVTKTSETRKF